MDLQTVEQSLADRFTGLLDTIRSSLSQDGLRQLHAFCTDAGLFSEDQLHKLSKSSLLNELSRFGIINEDNMQLLKFIARASKQQGILNIVEEFEAVRPCQLSPLPANLDTLDCTVPGYTIVSILVLESVDCIDRRRIESVCRSTADVCSIKYHEMAWLGYREDEDEDMIAIVVLLPSRCLATLQSRLDNEHDRTLEEIGIVDVVVQVGMKSRFEPLRSRSNNIDVIESPQVQALMRKISDGETVTFREISNATGPDIPIRIVVSLLSQATKYNNAVAVEDLAHILRSRTKKTAQSLFEILQTLKTPISLKLLPNAYIAATEKLVRALVQQGFVLHPAVESYTLLLATVSQKKDYPLSLFRFLLRSEETIEEPFQDCSKDDVYQRCVTYCCINGRDDLVLALLKRGATIATETAKQYSPCIGRAMKHIGCHSCAVRTPKCLVRCTEISWEKRRLTQINDDWLSQDNLTAFVTRLDISGNQLSSIPSSILDGTLPRLEEVDCSGNKLTSLWSDDTDEPLRGKYIYKLKVFNASRNQLESLPLRIFQIPSLEILNVSRNSLTSLPGPDDFSETTSSSSSSVEPPERCWLCTWLKELNLSYNCLARLPESFRFVLHLRKLNVSNNKLKSVAQSLHKARFLEHIDFSSNCLGSAGIEANLKCLPDSIQILKLCKNNFTFLPLPVLNITGLRRLDISNNSIDHLPYSQTWKLPHLESLILQGNMLGVGEGTILLPESFGKTLTHLDISHNQLTKFPETVLGLRRVVCIKLEGNPKITKLPREVATLKRLFELTIDGMKEAIREFDQTFHSDSPNVHYNRVKKIIRDRHYEYGVYCGVKIAISGNEMARASVIQELIANDYSGAAELPVVYSLVSTSDSFTLADPSKTVRHSRFRPFNYTVKTNITATFKLWSIPDNRSFIVLQHVFFSENTLHLLVWNDSDGSSGLDLIEDTVQLIRGSKLSVRTALVVLKTGQHTPEIQQRIASLEAKIGRAAITMEYNRRRHTNVSSLRNHLFQTAVELAKISESAMGGTNCTVPSSFRHAARMLFSSKSEITEASVCSRKFVENHMFPDGFSDPDDFDEAMRFLMRIGALLHYEDTPRNLHQHFFLNMDIVSRVLVAVTSGGSSHLSSGVAHARHIYAIFSKLSVSKVDGDALFALLIRLSVVVPLDCCRCLLPFRLPSQKPGLYLSLSQYLTPIASTDGQSEFHGRPTYVRRLYSTTGLPPCFWGRFVSALVFQIQQLLDSLHAGDQHRAKTNAIFWAGGILASYDEGCFIVNVVESNSSECTTSIEGGKLCMKSGLDIVVFDRRRQFASLGLICSHVERLLQEWIDASDNDYSYSSAEEAVSSVKRLVPYPPFDLNSKHSVDELLNDFIFEHAVPENATLHTVEDCAQAIVERSFLNVVKTETVNVSHLVPDLMLFSVPPDERLENQDVKIEVTPKGNLGSGGFANVYLGYLGEEQAAFKIFGTMVIPPTFDDIPLETKEEVISRTSKKGNRRSSRRKQVKVKKVASLNQLKLMKSFVGARIGKARVSEKEVKAAIPPANPQLDSQQCFKHLCDLIQEVTVMKQLQHKHIVQFKGILFDPYPCLVMEFAPGGNLATLINDRRDEIGSVSDLLNGVHFSGIAHDGILGRELTHRISFQIALGLEYLHSKSICHLDMKPENVLVWSESVSAPVNVKLTDYGIALNVTAVGVRNVRGTIGYQAPEQLVSKNRVGQSFDLRVDVFAYGMMIYYLLTGVHPFEEDIGKPDVVEHKVRQNDRPSLPTGQSLIHLQSVIDRCWRFWPSERPSACQIVSEMCEPSFHLHCDDLALNGKHNVLATTVMTEEFELVRGDYVDSGMTSLPVRSPLIRHRSLTCSLLPSLRAQGRRLKRPASVQCEPNVRPSLSLTERQMSYQDTTSVQVSHSRNFSTEMFLQFEEKKEEILRSPSPATSTEPTSCHEESTSPSKGKWSQATPGELSSGEESDVSQWSSEDEEITEPLFSFALLLTSDSLLVGDPAVSRFLCKQTTKKLISGDVSAVMSLHNRLWIGFRSKVIQVFECVNGEIIKRITQQSFSCNDIVEDIQYQVFPADSTAKVFALLANGQMVVAMGHKHDNSDANAPRSLNEWGRDAVYRWDQPEVRTLGKIGLEREAAAKVTSCIVLPRLGELWYCQGNSIVAVNTFKSPEEVIPVDGSPTDSITVMGITIIKHAVVVGNSVWCSDDAGTLCEIQTTSETEKRSWKQQCWKLHELLHNRTQPSKSTGPAGYVCDRRSPMSNASQFEFPSVQCLAAVQDTLWVACNNGAILIVYKDGEEMVRLLATLRCRPLIDHALAREKETPSITVRNMKQVGDRVLVYQETHPASAEQIVIAEVFEAVDSSQLKKITSYYNIHNA